MWGNETIVRWQCSYQAWTQCCRCSYPCPCPCLVPACCQGVCSNTCNYGPIKIPPDNMFFIHHSIFWWTIGKGGTNCPAEVSLVHCYFACRLTNLNLGKNGYLMIPPLTEIGKMFNCRYFWDRWIPSYPCKNRTKIMLHKPGLCWTGVSRTESSLLL